MEADLAFYTLDELRFSGSHDALDALVLCGAHRADRVMVAWQWLVKDGRPIGVDVDQLRENILPWPGRYFRQANRGVLDTGRAIELNELGCLISVVDPIW